MVRPEFAKLIIAVRICSLPTGRYAPWVLKHPANLFIIGTPARILGRSHPLRQDSK